VPTRVKRKPPPAIQGLAARQLAAEAVDQVLSRGMALEEAFDGARPDIRKLDSRDLALARKIAGTAMRRFGSIGLLLDALLVRGMPRKSGPLEAILVTGAAQILFLDVPDHAAVDLAVRLARADDRAQAFSGLANAVLRRLSREKAERLPGLPAAADTPRWLHRRWTDTYGPAAAAAIELVQRHEPPLDLSVKSDPAHWAERLGGRLLPTGSIRLSAHGPIPSLAGYEDGAWWVQDAAAALPARLLGTVAGMRVADLCAAPGGKTAQLAAGGAAVTALDRAPARLDRLRDNLERLSLSAEIVAADLLSYEAAPFDAVLLDAPCSATGTIRRHPDVQWSKTAEDIGALADLQRRLLAKAADLVKPGGLLVYCTCSLEPEEGERQVEAFLASGTPFERVAIRPGEIAIPATIDARGDLRTLPSMLPDPDPAWGGLDGFFAARLRRADR
jgi:16S rRNA (cytosine967-C5)-methyltransferase